MKKKTKYTWYINPLDAQTNETIAELVNDENFCSKSHLWRCDIDIVLALKRSADSLGVKFEIYNQQGNGQIRKVPSFIFKKRRKKKAKTAL